VPADEFADLDASVPWSEPVALLAPELIVQGEPGDKLGTWRYADCNPAESSTGCLSVTLERDAAGDVQGYFEQADRASEFGTFAPPVDADLGYPREVELSDYASLTTGGIAGVHYRLSNASIAGDQLAFEWNEHEVWRDWCAMQTPYLWQIGERTFYFCVPQDERQWSSLDLGKVVLCRSADVMELCDGRIPCVCIDASDPLCSPAYCRCDAQSCGLPREIRKATITFNADKRTAFYTQPYLDSASEVMLRLEKVAP
jgi:hypothetical protein